MEAVIKQQLNGTTPEELAELTVEGVPCAKVEGLSDSFTSLARLSVVNCGLKSLDGLPKLPKLTTLLLGDNKLSGGDTIQLVVSCCPQLHSLSLVGNRFASLDDLKKLAELSDLKDLDLFNCPVTSQEGYRDDVFSALPSLTSLDGFDRDGKEVNPPGEEDDEDDEEADSEEEEDDGPGLEYLQKEILDSEEDDDEGEFDPEAEGSPGSEDYTIEEEDEEGDSDNDDDSKPGPSKRQRLEEPGPAAPVED